jgi:PAS domain S-box-containing protein
MGGLARGWASLPLRVKGLVVVAIPVTALLLVSGLFYLQQRRDTRLDRAIQHQLEVRSRAQRVRGLVVEAETGVRGYLLTGRGGFLEPYRRARRALPEAWATLNASVAAEPASAAALQRLGPIVEHRMEFLGRFIRPGALDRGAAETRRDLLRGKILMDRVHSGLGRLEDSINRELRAGEAEARRADRASALVIALGVIVGLGGGLLASVLFARGIERRIGRLEDNAHRLEDGVALAGLPLGGDEIGRLGRALHEGAQLLVARTGELRASNEFLEDLISSSPGIIFRWNESDGRLPYLSPNVERVLGWPSEAQVADAAAWRERLHPEDRERVIGELEAAVAERAPSCRLEGRVAHGAGGYRCLSAAVDLGYGPGGSIESVLAFASDVTEAWESERALREQEETLEAVVNASPDIITLLDPDGGVRSTSGAVRDVLGYPPDDYGRRVDLIHRDDRPAFAAVVRDLLEGAREERTLRMRVRHNDGHWVTVETRGRAIADGVGAAQGVVMVSREVTAQVTLEAELRGAREHAEKANREKSEFVSRMSHELRTPLNAILGFGQLLEMDDLNDEQRESVQQVLRSGRHLLQLIDEVLDISRVESGHLDVSLEPVAVGEVIVESLDMVRPLAASQGISLEPVLAPPCDLHVSADRQRLKQVLLNLLSNAVKYNREDGNVTVGCTEVGGSALRIVIGDNGCGIPEEKMARLFRPFERLGAEETGVAGTGLGLALSQRLVRAMGGRLTAESTVGEGSLFSVELPVVADPLVAQSAEIKRLHPALGGGGDERTVLYVEDNLSNLRLVERILSQHPGVRLVPAMKGRLALELARERCPDLVLLDLHLPDIRGEDVLEQLRADPATQRAPVVVISADATAARIQRLLDAGARDYLTKPLELRRFLEVVSAALAERVS